MELKIKKLLKKYESEVNREPDQKEIERYELLKAVIDDPEKPSNHFVKQIEKHLGYPPIIFVKGEFKFEKLGWRKHRDEWVQNIRQVALFLNQFVYGESSNYNMLYKNIKQALKISQNPPRRMTSKAVLITFCETLSNTVSYKDSLNSVNRFASFTQANTLLNELIDLIASERELDKQMSDEKIGSSLAANRTSVEKDHYNNNEEKIIDSEAAKDRLPSPVPNVEEALKQIREMAIRIACLEQEKLDLRNESHTAAQRIREMNEKIELVEQENINLQTSSQIAEHRVKVLQEELAQTRDAAALNAVTSFFQEMNSVKHSSLLDQFLKTEKLLGLLHQQQAEIPKELELIPTLVNMFSRFIEKQGIQPKHEVGSKREITLSESDQYEYFGSQFENSDERKTVELLSSGWTYNGDLIIKPKVREVS